jgi:parallel beta-helix repeat protein
LNNNAGQSGSSGGGAGIYLSISGTGSSVQVKDNIIKGNVLAGSFGDGGGLNINASSIVMSNNIIAGNQASSSFGDGGGIYLSGYGTMRSLIDNQITNNTAADNGGGLYWTSGTGEISRNKISGNTCSDNGGGIYFYSTSSPASQINRNLIFDNKASAAGGGIYCESSTPKIVNNTFDGNRCSSGGGAIYLKSSSPEIVNNILSNNEQYAVHESDANSDPPCRYNDFWGNITGLYYDEGARGFNSLSLLESLVPEAHHNLAVDALFVDRAGKDYHLKSVSACINAGDPTSPKDPDSTRADIGALYYDQAGGDITPPPPPLNLVANGANPSPWKNTTAFVISWNNPTDPSGIARAIYKLGTAPTSNTDTTGSASGIPPFNLNATQQGGQMLYVWLRDGAGNTNYQNNASVSLRYDGTAPLVPVLVSPLNNASTNNPKPTFDWSDATDAGGSGIAEYVIQVDNNVDFSSPEFNATSTSSMTTPLNNLAHGTYSWRVRAKDTATNLSNWSPVWILQIDTQSPAKVTNLTVTTTTSSSVTLSWTAPGDDGNSGVAAQYDLRFSTMVPGMDTTSWWNSATKVSAVPAPKSAGTAESFIISGLQPNTTYYLALKTADEASNWSSVSKVTSGKTQPGAGGPHFKFKTAEDSYSIVVDAATIDGQSLQPGDEIGVFTPAGFCVGASIWTGTTPVALTAWKDDSQTPEIDGYKDGEKMSFRIWDNSAALELAAIPTYSTGNGNFGNGAYARISLLKATSIGQLMVSIQDATGSAGSMMNIPVLVTDVTGKGIISVALTVQTDTSVLIPLDAFNIGTITAGWQAPTYSKQNGQINIAMTGATPLSGSGFLVFIKFLVNSKAAMGNNSVMHLEKIMFNEGDPTATTRDGVFTVTIGTKISGKINYYPNELPVKNVLVSLKGSSSYEVTTDLNGQYEFMSVLPGNYTSSPKKKDDLDAAISPFDAGLILQYAVGQRSFTPYQMLAADVSGNGQVTAYDASLILRYYVKLIPTLPVVPDSVHFWRFVPKSYLIDNTNWSTAPDSLRYAPLNSDKLDQNFVGIIYGDPSGNWNPSGAVLASGKSFAKSVSFRLGDIQQLQNKSFTMPIEIDEGSELISSGLIIEFDSKLLKIVDITTTELTSGFTIVHSIESDQIKIALAGSRLLTQDGAIVNIKCEILDASKDMTNAMALTNVLVNEGNILANIQPSDINSQATVPAGFVLCQNYPNPFNPETTIKYQLPQKGRVELKVFNVAGQQIKTLVNEEKEAGCYEVRWDGTDNSGKKVSSGLYIYQLKSGDFFDSKKLAVLR